MTESNRHVPFPELLGQPHNLEEIIVNMAHGKLPSYQNLPQTLTAGNTEVYANWLSQLTQQDNPQRERSTIIHVHADTDTVLYSPTPDVGSETSAKSFVTEDRTTFVPTINIHSHRKDTCHSIMFGSRAHAVHSDMTTLIVGSKEENFTPLGMLVTNPDHNYLIFRTQETPTEPYSSNIYPHALQAYTLGDFLQFQRYGTEVGRSITDSALYEKLLKQAEAVLGLPIRTYYDNFLQTFHVAQVYHLGFYRSNKDGTYERVTKDMLLGHMSQYLNNIFLQAQNSQ